MKNIYSLATTPVADSGWINGTSNKEYSDWVVYTYFHIENGQPIANFKVLDKDFSNNPPLFETDSYQELEEWIESHKEEIQEQINKKVKKYKQ